MEEGKVSIQPLLEPDGFRPFLERQRWFGGKARSIASVRVADAIELRERGWLTVITVAFNGGDPQDYLVPLTIVEGNTAETLRRERHEAVVALSTTAAC
jgi:maltose alpha-D-glucosyltransferase / alpha-amylase